MKSKFDIIDLKEESVEAVFRSELQIASKAQNLELNYNTKEYINILLCKYLKQEVFQPEDDKDKDKATTPLAKKIYKAIDKTGKAERALNFQNIGDYTIFVAGFFSSSFSQSLIDINYYIGIGRNCYNEVAVLQPKTRNLFLELSQKFQPIVDVLITTSNKLLTHSDINILNVYTRWLKTGSKQDLATLKKFGIIPIQASLKLN